MTNDDRRLFATVLASLLRVMGDDAAERVLGYIEATAGFLTEENQQASREMIGVCRTARLMMSEG